MANKLSIRARRVLCHLKSIGGHTDSRMASKSSINIRDKMAVDELFRDGAVEELDAGTHTELRLTAKGKKKSRTCKTQKNGQ